MMLKECDRESMMESTIRKSRRKTSIYTYPFPECSCLRQQSQNSILDQSIEYRERNHIVLTAQTVSFFCFFPAHFVPFSHEICNAKAVGHYSCIGEMQISEFLPCSGFVVTSFLFVSARNFPFNCVSEQRFVSLLVFFRCLFAFFFFFQAWSIFLALSIL